MFSIDFPEIVIIFGIALVVLGPKKLPGAAAQIGRWVGRARSMARQFREQLEQEVNTVESSLDIKKAMESPAAETSATQPRPTEPAASTSPEVESSSSWAAAQEHALEEEDPQRDMFAPGGWSPGSRLEMSGSTLVPASAEEPEQPPRPRAEVSIGEGPGDPARASGVRYGSGGAHHAAVEPLPAAPESGSAAHLPRPATAEPVAAAREHATAERTRAEIEHEPAAPGPEHARTEREPEREPVTTGHGDR